MQPKYLRKLADAAEISGKTCRCSRNIWENLQMQPQYFAKIFETLTNRDPTFSEKLGFLTVDWTTAIFQNLEILEKFVGTLIISGKN